MGQVLKADALLLLSIEGREKGRLLKVVVNGEPRVLLLKSQFKFATGHQSGHVEGLRMERPESPNIPGYRDCYTNHKGDVLESPSEPVALRSSAPPGTTFDRRTTARPLSIDFPDCWPATLSERVRLLGGVRAGTAVAKTLEVEGARLIEYHGLLYVPGSTGAIWFRIDPETFRAEALDPGPDHPRQSCWYGVSNCYGLVGGCRVMRQSPACPSA